MNCTKPVLEVIASSVVAAIEAERGGAGRLEIIRDFKRGGMTPPLGLVRDILAAVSMPVRVMLRESDGYAVTGTDEIERLCAAAGKLSTLGVEGLVLGFISNRKIDVDLTSHILSCAPNLRATFHHAFEETREPFKAIDQIKTIRQVDRILTNGGGGDWQQMIARLSSYQQAAQPEITILAGGGLDQQLIQRIREATGISEFHVGRAARVPAHADGAVRATVVRELVQAVNVGTM